MEDVKSPSRIPTETATDTVMRAMSSFQDDVDRVLIITLNKDGESGGVYSNARSAPEAYGILSMTMDGWFDYMEGE